MEALLISTEMTMGTTQEMRYLNHPLLVRLLFHLKGKVLKDYRQITLDTHLSKWMIYKNCKKALDLPCLIML